MLAMGASCGVLAGAAEADTTPFCRPDLPQAQRTTAARRTQPRLRITRRQLSMSPFAHSLALGAVRATGAAPMHVLRRRFPTSSLPSGTHELLSADGLTVFRGSWREVRIFVPDARRPELSDPRPSQIRAAARNHFPGRRTSLAGHLRCRGAQERGRRGARARTGPGDRKSTRLNSSHSQISYAVFCLKKKKKNLKHNTARKYKTYTMTK